MKNLIITVIILALFAGAFLFFGNKSKTTVVYTKNETLKPMDIVPNKMLDPQCKMYIETQKHSAEVILDDHRTYFFDDVGCMVLWLKNKKNLQNYHSYVFTEDTHRWLEANKACYKIGIHTPMHYGFGAYEKKMQGCISYDNFKLKMYRGETMANPIIRKKYLGK